MTARDPLPAQAAALNAIFAAADPFARIQREQAAEQKRIADATVILQAKALEVAAHAISIAQSPSWCRGEFDLMAIAFDDLRAAVQIVDPPWEENAHDDPEYRVMDGEAREKFNESQRREP